MNYSLNKDEILSTLREELSDINDIQNLQNLKSKYLGKNGLIKSLMKNLKNLDDQTKREYGKIINELKNEIEDIFENKLAELKKAELEEKEKENWIDVTIPGAIRKVGKESFITKTIKEIEEIFIGMGFSIAEGP